MNKLPQIAIPVEPEILKKFRVYASLRGKTVAAAGREIIEKIVLEDNSITTVLLANKHLNETKDNER